MSTPGGGAALSSVAGARIWLTRDGTPVSCREKLKVLDDNLAELAQVMRDAFEDAILMDVGETEIRQALHDVVASLRTPLAPPAG